jgi:adenylate cyclase
MKRIILIVDNDSDARNALRQVLEPEGHHIVQAESGEQALALALEAHVDVFLLAIETPRINGIMLCKELRAIDRYRKAPIILLTGSSADRRLHQALEAGGDDFIEKPYWPVIVQARLRLHFQRLDYSRRLKQYLPKRTHEDIESDPPNGALGKPEERDLAICFTDVRGFTAFSEGTEPARLFSLVSELVADQVNIIHDYGGYVDKFGGDGVMAVFDGPEMVLQSCLCALNILENTLMQNSLHPEEIRRVGIGIHTGRAVVGNIGSPEHLDYSAIGTTVNLAARLCGQAQATSIVVSKAVRDAVASDPRLKFRSERRVPIRGFKEQVTVYTLRRGEPANPLSTTDILQTAQRKSPR